MPEPEEIRSKTKKTDPKGLTSEYHKAHKQLMLWATLLFIWEFVGVNLENAKEAGGNIGPIVAALKSPQAVPWVLLVLVFYFLFKCSVEWAQCHVDRRKVLFARIDYGAALTIAGAAITLYFGQAASRAQFADALQGSRSLSIMMGLTAGIPVGMLGAVTAALYLSGRSGRKPLLRRTIPPVFILTLSIVYILLLRDRLIPSHLFIGSLLGISVGGIPFYFFFRRFRKVISD